MKVCRTRIRRGTTTLEYVLVSASILAVLVTTIFLVGQMAEEKFNNVTSVLDGNGERIAVAANREPATGSATESQANTNSILNYILLFAALGLTVSGTRFLLRSRKKPKDDAAPPCPATQKVLKQQSEAMRRILDKRNVIHATLREDWIQLFEGNSKIGSYMSTDVTCVRPEMPTEDCLEMLLKHGYRRAMVTDQQGHLLGVVSKKDIQLKFGSTVADVMTDDPKIAQPTTSLKIALSLLISHRVSCIPIVEDGRLVGLLSTSDLLVVLQSVLIILCGEAQVKLDNGQQVALKID